MADEKTPPSLLLRVRDRDNQTAWRDFEVRYRELIQRYCLRRGLRPTDCDDVQQIVWLHLSKGMRTFEYDPAKGKFRDYLGRVVHSAIARHFASHEPANAPLDRALLVNLQSVHEAENRQWEEEWVNHHYRLAMTTIEQAFHPRSVEIFNRLIGGESVANVAKELCTTEQAVHKVKQRIRSRMQELIAQQVREEDEPDA